MTKKQINKLDKLFREVIRKRDKVCQKTGRRTNLQVCHFITRSNKYVRWNMDNALLLSAGNHIFWAHKNPLEFTEFMRKRLGKRYDLLRRAARETFKLHYEDIKFRLEYELAKQRR